MESEIKPHIYVEPLDEFEEWNHDTLKDIYNEIKGFFGGIRSYTYFVREVYIDTYSLNGSDLIYHNKYFRTLEPYDEERSPAYNAELLREYNAIEDLGDRIRHEIMV